MQREAWPRKQGHHAPSTPVRENTRRVGELGSCATGVAAGLTPITAVAQRKAGTLAGRHSPRSFDISKSAFGASRQQEDPPRTVG